MTMTKPIFPVLEFVGAEFAIQNYEDEFLKASKYSIQNGLYKKKTLIDSRYKFFKIKNAKIVSSFRYGGYWGLFKDVGYVVDYDYAEIEPMPFLEFKSKFTRSLKRTHAMSKMIGEDDFYEELDAVNDFESFIKFLCNWGFGTKT